MQPNKPIQIGQVLVQQGVLSDQQVFEIVQEQKRLRLPFGVLAERMFEVSVESIENAWIEQYHQYTGTLDLRPQEIDERALRLINRRQAWQFQMLPIGWQRGGELLIAAARHRLARAVTFAASAIEHVVYFRVAESTQLKSFLKEHYPMPEVSDALIKRAKSVAAAAGEPSR